jgi:hypothetical protein
LQNHHHETVRSKGPVAGRHHHTVIFAENDYKARQLIRMQFGDALASIHYVREA